MFISYSLRKQVVSLSCFCTVFRFLLSAFNIALVFFSFFTFMFSDLNLYNVQIAVVLKSNMIVKLIFPQLRTVFLKPAHSRVLTD